MIGYIKIGYIVFSTFDIDAIQGIPQRYAHFSWNNENNQIVFFVYDSEIIFIF